MRHLLSLPAVGLVVAACAGPQTDEASFGSTKPPAPFVLAVYNKDNLLATDPVRDMRELLAHADAHGEPYTDVYVVSHGWNYTPPEALGAYERYHAKLVEFLVAQGEPVESPDGDPGDGALPGVLGDDRETFNPLMVYVAWNSVARPLTELTSSILPFGLDEAISSPTQVIDSTVFFLPSVWKQSLNAYGNAIGRHYPAEYVGRDGAKLTSRELVLKGNTGYDVPLSEVVLRAMEASDAGGFDVHLVGHSFGAKLVALAGIEALRRHEHEHPGERLDGKLDSLMLFNAAFHPQELTYIVDECDEAVDEDLSPLGELHASRVDALLRHVPGKAMVYSNHDFAAGLLFDISQFFVNTGTAQAFHQVVARPSEIPTPGEEPSGVFGTAWRGVEIVFTGATDLVTGGLGLASTVVLSVIEWPVRKVANLFGDFPHHVAERDGLLGRPGDTGNVFAAAGVGLYNALTYFVPIEVTNVYGGVADQRGFYRHTLPALGRTGIAGLWRGRLTRYPDAYGDDAPLYAFAFDEEGRERDGAEVDRTFFAEYVAAPDRTRLRAHLAGDRFTSIDATAAYDSLTPFVGAHGDLRSSDEYETPESGKKRQKIDATLRFVLDWTREAGALDD